MINRRVFVAIEGLSGSGKTTIATLLAGELGGTYYKTPPEVFVPIRKRVDSSASPLARYLYYFAGIAQASAEIGKIILERPVVCDKYLATMLAYSRAAGVVVDILADDLILQPDYAFYIDVPDDVRLHRVSLRGRISKVHRAFLHMESTQKVAEQYRQLGVVVIDNGAPNVSFAMESILRHLPNGAGARDVAEVKEGVPWCAKT